MRRWTSHCPSVSTCTMLVALFVTSAACTESLGALQGTLDAHLRDISAGLVPSVSWSAFKRDVAHNVDAREAGQIDSVTVWTFDRDMQLAELLYYSVDGVMTNQPESLYVIWQDTLN